MEMIENRILKWKELAKAKKESIDELALFHQESIKLEAEKRRNEKIQFFLEKVPLRFRDKTFFDYQVDYPEQGRVKKIIERYADTFSDRLKEGASLQFLGSPGTGKTFLSLILYQALVKQGFLVQYESSLDFLKILQEKKFASQAAYESLLNHYTQIQLLIIDEVTEAVTKTGIPSEWERKLLFKVLDARYQKKLCTLIVSNRNQESLVERLGNPIVDRLADQGMMLAFTWNSYRQPSLKIS